MGEIATKANEAWRDHVTDGVPSSGDHKPPKPDIRDLFTIVDGKIAALEGRAGSPTPTIYNGIGNGATNDLAAFQSLSTNHPGEQVNLLGRAWYINANDPPHNLHYYNGTIRTTTREINYPGTPRTHMFDGEVLVELDRRPAGHPWTGPIGELSGASTETLLISYVKGWRHEVNVGAPIMVTHRSDGTTPDETVSYWSNRLYEPRGLVGGMISATRFGIAFILVDASNAHPADPLRFVYSDDGGKTKPTEQVMCGLGDVYYPHSFKKMDDGTCWFFGMRSSRYVVAQKRTAAGTFETPFIIKDCHTLAGHGGSDAYAEPHAEYIPGKGWYVLVRDNDGSQANYYGFTANADFSSVTAIVSTGLTNERNPPKVTYWDGRLVHQVSSRSGTAIAARRDELMFWSVPAAAAFDTLAAGNPITAVGRHYGQTATLGQTAIGYLEIMKLASGKWVGVGIDRESQTGSSNPQSSRLFMIGGNRSPMPSPYTAMNPPIRFLGLNNRGYQDAPVGTTFNGITSATKTVALHRHSSNTGVDVSRVAIAGSIHEYATRILDHRPPYALRLVRSSGASGTEQTWRLYGREAILSWSAMPVSWGRWMSGTMPQIADAHRFVIRINAGAGGSGAPADETVVWAGLGTYTDGLNLISGIAKIPDLSGVTWGTDPYMEIAFINNVAGTMDAWDFGWWVNEGHTLIFPPPPDMATERALIDRRVERKEIPNTAQLCIAHRAATDDAGGGTLAYVPKGKTPTIYLTGGATYANFLIDGNAGTPLTNLIFGDIGFSSATVLAYRTGFYTATDARRIKSNQALGLIIEGEW